MTTDLKWTTEPPEVPGWYWERFKSAYAGDIMRVRELGPGGLKDVANHLREVEKAGEAGRIMYAGPIPGPKE